MITIFTPAYNRAHTLGRLYQSLCAQTFFDFEWLVVDDGSSDNTRELIASFQKECSFFRINYVYQENGGKHRAINRGVQLAKGTFFFIVDSDDYLTSDAVALIFPELAEIEDDMRFCGITVLRIYSNGKPIGSYIPEKKLDTDLLTFQIKYKATGDYADIVKTAVLKKYPFPEFEGEKFCTEAVVWNRLTQKYISRYLSLGVYVCEYLPDGLTATYNKIMQDSPQCSMIYYKELAIKFKQVPALWKIKYQAVYWRYYRLNQKTLNEEVKPTIWMFCCYPFLSLMDVIYRYIKSTRCFY